MSTMNTVGRPTTPNALPDNDYKHPTLTGARGLLASRGFFPEGMPCVRSW